MTRITLPSELHTAGKLSFFLKTEIELAIETSYMLLFSQSRMSKGNANKTVLNGCQKCQPQEIHRYTAHSPLPSLQLVQKHQTTDTSVLFPALQPPSSSQADFDIILESAPRNTMFFLSTDFSAKSS
jgi:hypothetical protein